jgi:hypothetical protein
MVFEVEEERMKHVQMNQTNSSLIMVQIGQTAHSRTTGRVVCIDLHLLAWIFDLSLGRILAFFVSLPANLLSVRLSLSLDGAIHSNIR